jgi:hypothetical protein
MEKKKLKLGTMTGQEMADWFGIKLNTYRQTKAKKLRELENFAKFHIEKQKVYIDEIYIEVYSKRGSRTKQIVEEEFEKTWNKDGLDSCSRVSQQIMKQFGEELGVKEDTVRHYTLGTRKKLYGTPWVSSGSKGSCIFIWCKKHGEGADAHYELLTPAEEEIKKELIKKYFGDSNEKQIIVQGMVAKGEITREEAWGVLEELTGMNHSFYPFLLELQEKVGATVVKGTLVNKEIRVIEDGECFNF